MHRPAPGTGQSAQADFAIFQRRIHSLLARLVSQPGIRPCTNRQSAQADFV
ncbi:MAG TPA: hypothetical protein VLK84_02790 [Longimicrobium sp.]|nr:hypothetical protein [Longimicrobium sp.]